MQLKFHKYQGTGNDFIMLDNTHGNYDNLAIEQIKQICDRRFGVGADGVIKINSKLRYDFEVDYYNADGTKSFCGNGARCAVRFAHELGLIKGNETCFWAIDGEHNATLSDTKVSLKMTDVSKVDELSNQTFEMNTGSPHYLVYLESIDAEDVATYGKKIRYNDRYKEEGINVNLIEEQGNNSLKVYTYERGVEAETLSCGTGVTAAALSFAYKNKLKGNVNVAIQTKGGELSVKFDYGTNFTNIWLIGPAQFVFEGNYISA